RLRVVIALPRDSRLLPLTGENLDAEMNPPVDLGGWRQGAKSDLQPLPALQVEDGHAHRPLDAVLSLKRQVNLLNGNSQVLFAFSFLKPPLVKREVPVLGFTGDLVGPGLRVFGVAVAQEPKQIALDRVRFKRQTGDALLQRTAKVRQALSGL